MTQEKLDEIDQRLEAHAEQIAQLRNQQEADAATFADLRSLTSELLEIAQLHQRALRVSQTRHDEATTEIRRIWEYLLGQQRNGNGRGEE